MRSRPTFRPGKPILAADLNAVADAAFSPGISFGGGLSGSADSSGEVSVVGDDRPTVAFVRPSSLTADADGFLPGVVRVYDRDTNALVNSYDCKIKAL